MESWRELFDIFLNSPTPESDASLWLQSHQSSTNASSSPPSTPITTLSFLSFLSHPVQSIATDPKRKVMWIQTLPNMVQVRVFSFLKMDYKRFDARELAKLSENVLAGGEEVDFWVRRSARQLLDVLSVGKCDSVSRVVLDFDGFYDVPDWLKDAGAARGSFLPWLPLLPRDLNLEPMSVVESGDDFVLMAEKEMKDNEKTENDMEIGTEGDAGSLHCLSNPLKPETCEMAERLKGLLCLCFESTSKVVDLANEIWNLCLDKGHDSLQVLGLMEPWQADDQTAAILISQLVEADDDELGWPSQVLCSFILPKLLVLEEPASRMLTTAIVNYCKQYPRAAVHALLSPLFLTKDGINRHQCDIITKLITECLHPTHASAFFQRLLTMKEKETEFLTLPCHQHLLSENMIWTESTFSMLQNVLDHNIHLTQDSVDHVVSHVLELAEAYPKSLKFGTFLLRLVTKCRPMLIPHKHLLSEAARRTNTILTKSLLAKLASM